MSVENMVNKSEVTEGDRTGGLDDEMRADPEPQKTLTDKIDEVLNTLTYQEREIIKLRLCLGNDYEYTQKEIGRIFRLTTNRVRKIEALAIRKLQQPIRSRKLEVFLDTLAAEDLMTPEGRLLQKVFGVSSGQWPPTLFEYATSERCQDAFISWLIAWARYDFREVNGPLQLTGEFFLNRLIGMHGFVPPAKYTKLRIQKYKQIDILVRVNSEFVVLIEDKIDFTEHSGQLERYLNTVRNDFPEPKPVPIYLKTGDQLYYGNIENAGWKCFLRRDMLEVLDYGKQQGVESDTFKDFHSRLRQMEALARKRRARGS